MQTLISWRRSWIVILASLPLVSVELLFPFGRDQGNYAYPAWRWLEGEMPYRDVYVFKPPATVWVHALAQLLFGHSMQAVRILDILWTLATALTLRAIAGRWGASPRAAAIAGVAYTFLYSSFDFWNTCQTDGWFNLPVALGLLLVTARPGTAGALLGAGALFGLAATFKYTAIAMVLPAAALVTLHDRRPMALLRAALLFAVGIMLPLAATGVWLWRNDAIPGFLDSQAHLVPAYVEKTGRAQGIVQIARTIRTRAVELEQLRYLFVAVTAGAAVTAARAWRDRVGVLAVLWFAAGLASTIVQNKFFRYHFLSALPGGAFLGAIAIDAVLSRFPRRATVLLGAFTALLLATSIFPRRWEAVAQNLTGHLSLRSYWSRDGFSINDMSVSDVLACARRVQQLTQPGDRVFVWGFDPVVNFLAERQTVSRFLYNYPFSVAWGDARYDQELLDALQADPPAIFVVGSKDATPHVTGNKLDSKQLFEAFLPLNAFVADRYGEPEKVRRYTLYRRKP